MQNSDEFLQPSKNVLVDLTATGFHNPVVERFLTTQNFPKELINDDPMEKVISDVLSNPNFSNQHRNLLADRLRHQYNNLHNAPAVDSPVIKNIEKLRDANSITVTTGQQLHIFLGPLFVIYKIISCIAHAKKLAEAYPDKQVIPIFWMASEDHDFDEIRSTKLYGQTYTWDIPHGGPVGRLNPSSLLPLVTQIKERIDHNKENLEFLNICEAGYKRHSTFAQATQYIVHQLFENQGLVVLDPDDHDFKGCLKGNIEADLFHHSNKQLIDIDIANMKSHGIKAPINTRPINYFWLGDDKRQRIDRHADKFQLVNSGEEISAENVRQRLENQPEYFSPNALLRPFYQQLLLPNVKYVTGGSEFVYWLELKTLMLDRGVAYPKLEIRASRFTLSSKLWDKWNEFGLIGSDFFESDEKVIQKLVNNENVKFQELLKLRNSVKTQFQNIQIWLNSETTSGPPKSLEKAEKAYIKSLEDLVTIQQNLHAEKGGNSGKILLLKHKIFSDSFNQERNEFIINHLNHVANCVGLSHFDTLSYCEPNDGVIHLA